MSNYFFSFVSTEQHSMVDHIEERRLIEGFDTWSLINRFILENYDFILRMKFTDHYGYIQL